MQNSYFSVDSDSVFLYTIKQSEDGNAYILRLLELDGLAATVHIDSSLVLSNPEQVSFFEENGEPLTLEQGMILLNLSPYETSTIKVNAEVPLPVSLQVTKENTTNAIHLSLSGGKGPYSIRRSLTPDFASFETLAEGIYDHSYDDIGALSDGMDYYYKVGGQP